MPMQKDYVTPSTGATASFHVVQMVSLDATGKTTSASVASYLSKDACEGGKVAMYMQTVLIDGLPSAQDAFEYAEAALAANAPADTSGAPLNRYVFAGAQIVT